MNLGSNGHNSFVGGGAGESTSGISGAGAESAISGELKTYSKGGGLNSPDGENGTGNGGGGKGGGAGAGTNGGSGIVIVRWPYIY
jgi:hypothetical protein